MRRLTFIYQILLLALILLPGLCIARSSNVDSLRQLLASKKLTEREQLNVYTELATQLTTKDFDKTISVAKTGLALANKLHDLSATGRLKHAIASAAYFAGVYDTAATYFYQSVTALEKAGDKKALAATFNSLAKLYRKTRQLDEAEQYYDKAMAIYRQLKDTTGQATIWNESGVVFEYREDYAEAVRRYSNSLQLAEMRGDKLAVSYALSNIAGVYRLTNRYDSAEAYMLKGLGIAQDLKDTFAMALLYADFGDLYTKKKDYAKAIEHLEISKAIGIRMKYLELLGTTYNQLASVAEQQKDFAKAYTYTQAAAVLRDSIYNIERNRQIQELNTQYETEKKEQQILLQDAELSRKNYVIAAIVAAMLLVIVVAYSLYKRAKLRQEAKMQQALMLQQQASTKAILVAEEKERQRIGQDLHDGVGQILSAVKMNLSVLQRDTEDATGAEDPKLDNLMAMVDESCKEVRAVSHNMMPNVLLKSGLVSAVGDFINKIDASALEVNLYTTGLNNRLSSDVETVLYRVIQECVNNVIKHAAATRMDISLINDEEGISVTIEDNGKGFDTSDMLVFEGIGLKNIVTRVNYLQGTVEFQSQLGKGTVTMIHIPPAGG